MRIVQLVHCASIALIFAGPISYMHASAAETNDPVKMEPGKHLLKAGDTAKFGLTLEILPGGDAAHKIVVSEKYTRKNKEVKSDGAWAQETRFTKTMVHLGGMDIDSLAQMPVITVARDAKGVYTGKPEGGSPEGRAEIVGAIEQIAALTELLQPTSVVTAGASWKFDITNTNLMIGDAKLKGTATLVSTEKVGKRDTYKISFKAPGSGGDKAPSTEGTVNIDAVSGQLVRLHQIGTGQFAGGSANVTMDVMLAEE